jgi:MoxR-like ATPase
VSFAEIGSVEDASAALAAQGYLADRPLALGIHLAVALEQPLLLEGEAGVGKTEVARALASATGARLIRRQLLALRAAEAGVDEGQLFSRRFLLRRPLLEALEHDGPVVLLIDEIDRADDEFEAFLLEILSDFQISIPELGTIRAETSPVVILTSNRTRELHDALRRRCLYHWIGYPTAAREAEIVAIREPGAAGQLIRKVVTAAQRLRELDLAKPPGVAETIDWVRTLGVLGETELTAAAASDTLGAVVKDRDDLDLVRENLAEIISGG